MYILTQALHVAMFCQGAQRPLQRRWKQGATSSSSVVSFAKWKTYIRRPLFENVWNTLTGLYTILLPLQSTYGAGTKRSSSRGRTAMPWPSQRRRRRKRKEEKKEKDKGDNKRPAKNNDHDDAPPKKTKKVKKDKWSTWLAKGHKGLWLVWSWRGVDQIS